MSKLLKNALHIRGDSLYCPLAFSLDSYSNCLTDCVHCYIRRLNEVWGKELRPMDVENFRRTLHNGLKNDNPKSSLAWAIHQKKTLRFGNKADPFQEAEREHRVSKEALITLCDLKWDVVIETKFLHVLWDYADIIFQMKGHVHVMPILSVGLNGDWELFERKITTNPYTTLDVLRYFKNKGIDVGVNGEPFIPGYHTPQQFTQMMEQLNRYGIPSYNIYNLHFNAFVAKRLHAVGVDIEKVWYYNQDKQWRPILQQLIDIAKAYNIRLGCPDFVNSGWGFHEQSNTCCGVNVQNPCTWNTMTWKRMAQEGTKAGGNPLSFFDEVAEVTKKAWDGLGDYWKGIDIMKGTEAEMYTMKDIKED